MPGVLSLLLELRLFQDVGQGRWAGGCRWGELWLPETPHSPWGPEVASLSVSGVCPSCTVLQLLEGHGLVCPSAQAGPWGL